MKCATSPSSITALHIMSVHGIGPRFRIQKMLVPGVSGRMVLNMGEVNVDRIARFQRNLKVMEIIPRRANLLPNRCTEMRKIVRRVLDLLPLPVCPPQSQVAYSRATGRNTPWTTGRSRISNLTLSASLPFSKFVGLLAEDVPTTWDWLKSGPVLLSNSQAKPGR